MLKGGFKRKITLFYASMIVLIQLVTLFCVYEAIKNNAIEQVQLQLANAGNLLRKQLYEQAIFVGSHAKNAIAVPDGLAQLNPAKAPAVEQYLIRLQNQLKVDRVILVSANGEIINDTSNDPTSADVLPKQILRPNTKSYSMQILPWGQELYQFSLIPVPETVPALWVGVGQQMDDQLANHYTHLASLDLEVSFLMKGSAGWQVVGSSLHHNESNVIQELMPAFTSQLQQSIGSHTINDKIIHLVKINHDPHIPVLGLLEYCLSDALRPYQALFYNLGSLSILGLILAWVGSSILSANLLRPLYRLVKAAQKIQAGDYKTPVLAKLDDEFGEMATAFNHMMASISAREEALIFQSSHDSLTGLPNRKCYEKVLRDNIIKAQQSGGHFAVVLVCMDRLSEINYTLGHVVGDDLVKHVGLSLSNMVNASSVTARFSEDMFILLIPTCNQYLDIIQSVQNIHDLFKEPFFINQINIDIELHIGVSFFPEHGGTADCLIQRADVAMYLSQQSVQRYMIYDGHKDPYNKGRLALLGEFKQAIQKNEFILHFQPKLTLNGFEVKQAECLVRWLHPQKGLIPPGKFIPLAEQTGHLHELTLWVLAQAIEQLARWAKQGISLALAVNVSVKDLLSDGFKTCVSQLISEHQIAPKRLILEITESSVMEEPELVLKTITTLADLGIVFSIDDFGTGYSSMTYLKRLPVYELKIDKSFIEQLADNAEDRAIVGAIVELGQKLGLTVTAEGVETVAVFRQCEALGINTVQGFLVSKPVDIDGLTAFLAGESWHKLH